MLERGNVFHHLKMEFFTESFSLRLLFNADNFEPTPYRTICL